MVKCQVSRAKIGRESGNNFQFLGKVFQRNPGSKNHHKNILGQKKSVHKILDKDIEFKYVRRYNTRSIRQLRNKLSFILRLLFDVIRN